MNNILKNRLKALYNLAQWHRLGFKILPLFCLYKIPQGGAIGLKYTGLTARKKLDKNI